MEIKKIKFFKEVSGIVEDALGENICIKSEKEYDMIECSKSKNGILTRGVL